METETVELRKPSRDRGWKWGEEYGAGWGPRVTGPDDGKSDTGFRGKVMAGLRLGEEVLIRLIRRFDGTHN